MKKSFYGVIMTLLFIVTIINAKNETPVAAATSATVTLTKYINQIPTSSAQGLDLVNQGQVLYRITIKATVTNSSGGLISLVPITFSDPNTSLVKLMSTATRTTDSNGAAYAYYEVRGLTAFSCTATLNSATYTGTKTTSFVPSNPATYESSFYITCYNIASESDFSGSKISVSGISGYTFKSDFIAAVKLNGSGYTTNGFYIRYTGSDTYSIGNPVTSTGTTPTVGKTIAVDNYYIPRYNSSGTYLRGTVYLSNIGYRSAEDSGGAITGYHIDVFVGVGKAAVNAFIYQDSYQNLTYYGNNVNMW